MEYHVNFRDTILFNINKAGLEFESHRLNSYLKIALEKLVLVLEDCIGKLVLGGDQAEIEILCS